VLVCDVRCVLVTLLVLPFCCFAPAVILADKIGSDGPQLTRFRGLPMTVRPPSLTSWPAPSNLQLTSADPPGRR
jgi:hypothetical protein